MQFKKGDKIRRKEEYLKENEWRFGGSILTVDKDQHCNGTVFFIVNEREYNSAYGEYFELADKPLSIEEQVTYACSLIGKKNLKSKETDHAIHLGWTPVGIHIYFINSNSYYNKANANLSSSVSEYMKTHDVCVAIVSKNFANSCPVELIETPAESVSIKLNDKYEALVTEDTITVGCQEFPISILEELVKAHKSIQ